MRARGRTLAVRVACLMATLALVSILPLESQSGAATNSSQANPENNPERLVIPLEIPERPVSVAIVLAHGDLEIQAGPAGEILVEVTPADAGGVETDDGLFVIPDSALDLPIEVKGHRVSIGMWSTRVEKIRVTAPREASLVTKTIWSGNVVVDGLHGAHELDTNGGFIRLIRGRGSVVANSKNGVIDVELLEVTPGKPMSFTTLNGSIDIGFPPGFEADLNLSSRMGDVRSEFEITIAKSPTRISSEQTSEGTRYQLARDVRGTIGGGGPEISIRTHMGSISLRKSADRR